VEGGLTNRDGISPDQLWGDLLAAAQAGDAEAYRRFLTSVTPFLRALARRRSGSDDLADDILQDSLLTIHRVRHTYEAGRPVKPWLAAIATRRAIDALRRRGRQSGREVHDARAYETYADPLANRESNEEAVQAVAQMTGSLSPGQKQALELVKVKEMSLAEASAVSGQTIASLKVNVHRAIKKLRLNFARERPE
jgi:RNA polymerase sigma-70 factor (ECF subfamily)